MAKEEHPCPSCDQVFTRAQHVKRHIRIHTGEKPYPCNKCDERFSRADMLLRHKIKFHDAQSPTSATPSFFALRVNKKRTRSPYEDGSAVADEAEVRHAQNTPSRTSRGGEGHQHHGGGSASCNLDFTSNDQPPLNAFINYNTYPLPSYPSYPSKSSSVSVGNVIGLVDTSARNQPSTPTSFATFAQNGLFQSGGPSLLPLQDCFTSSPIPSVALSPNFEQDFIGSRGGGGSNSDLAMTFDPSSIPGMVSTGSLLSHFGGTLDWSDMMEPWAGVAEGDRQAGSVSAAWLATEVAQGAAGGTQAHPTQAPAAPQHQINLFTPFSATHGPTFPVPPFSAISNATLSPTPFNPSSSNPSPPDYAPSSSASSSSTSSTANGPTSSLILYSSSLRSFAQAILSSLPQSTVKRPRLTPLASSVAFNLKPPFRSIPTPHTQPEPQLKEPGEADSSPSPVVAFSPATPLTIIERRAATKQSNAHTAIARSETTPAVALAEKEMQKEEEEQKTTAGWFET